MRTAFKVGMKTTTAEREEAVAALRAAIKPGNTVYTILRHVSRSGMQRVIDIYIIENNEPRRWSYTAAQACGFNYDNKHEGIKVGGCGMDMGFHLVYSMSRTLFPDGFGIEGMTLDGRKVRPETEEHAAKMLAHTAYPGLSFNGRNGDQSGWDNDGGYALNHRWL